MINQGGACFQTSDMPALEGLITTTDLRGDRACAPCRPRRAPRRLRVADVMTPLSLLDAIELDSCVRGHASPTVPTLQRLGPQPPAGGAGGDAVTPGVRGIISRAQIERQLGALVSHAHRQQRFGDRARLAGLMPAARTPTHHHGTDPRSTPAKPSPCSPPSRLAASDAVYCPSTDLRGHPPDPGGWDACCRRTVCRGDHCAVPARRAAAGAGLEGFSARRARRDVLQPAAHSTTCGARGMRRW